MVEAIETIDAAALRRWFEHALRSLVRVRADVDVLNVFPVPDADTGTNMVLTLAGAAAAAAELEDDAGIGPLTAAAARGALYGARGNSGIILSQAIRGLAGSVAGRREIDAAGLVAALDAVARGARSAVAEPVEGTILTAADAAARAAAGLPQDAPLTAVVDAAAEAALTTLGHVDDVPTLAGRGVDAGAAAFVVLLSSLQAVVGGEDTGPAARARLARAALRPDAVTGAAPEADRDGGAAGGTGPGAVGREAEAACAGHLDHHGAGDFEVMYVLVAPAADAAALRERLGTVGTSVAVVGGADGDGPGVWHVHVHTDHPLAALATAGAMEQVCVRSVLGLPAGGPGLVACTRAPGLVDPLARAGAAVVLHPDAAGIARAAVDTGSRDVLVLPCDAESAALADTVAPGAARERTMLALGRQRVRVLATRGELEVLAAVAERVLGQEADEQAAALEAVAGRTRTRGVGIAEDLAAAVAGLVREGDEVVTLVRGRRALEDAGAFERVRAAVAVAAPDAELVVLDGAQAEPDLLLGAQ